MALARALFPLVLTCAAACTSPAAPPAPTSDPIDAAGAASGTRIVGIEPDHREWEAVAPRVAPALRTVPVLLFHSVCTDVCEVDDTYGITRADLASLLGWLGANGYTSIRSADYVRAVHGDRDGLPARPILLTFDDGRSDAYAGADSLLRDAQAVATMFVITGRPDSLAPGFMTWPEIVDAQASGRWDIQLHAADGHTQVAIGGASSALVTGPFFANRLYDSHTYELADGYLEPRAQWEARVRDDLSRGIDALRTHLGVFEPSTFAVPYGDYGQSQSNDPTIAAELRALFDATFPVWFTQSLAVDPAPSGSHEHFRYCVLRTTTPASIEAWLVASESAGAR